MVETGGWGGVAHYAWNLCAALSRAGADVTLLTNTRYELDALPRAFRVEGCFDGRRGWLGSARRLLRRLRELGPDVVHVQSLLSTRFDALLWPRVRRRHALVVTAHDVRTHEDTPWEGWTVRRCQAAADAVIVHTRESAEIVARRLGAGRPIEVIHHGDYAFFGDGARGRAEARAALGLPGRAKLLLAFGAIRPYKGIAELIEALPEIRRREPEAHLVVAGPLLVGTESEYWAAIERAAVGPHVTLRPTYVPYARVADYFRAADAAVFNYRDVTDSGALRIAASLGTPIVATAVGGFGEFLADGVSGRLVPPGDRAALVAAVVETLADPDAAAKRAEAARALAATAWSWDDSARATQALYARVTRRSGGAR